MWACVWKVGSRLSGMLLVAACKWMHASYQYV